jgi:hypothetical protein
MPALNYPGPQQIRLFYTTSPTGFPAIQHQARMNIQVSAGTVIPGTLFSALTVALRGGGSLALNTYIDNWVILMKVMMATAANNTIDYAELWQYPPLSFNGSFVSTYAINVAGTSALAALPAVQNMITFRTIEGGIMKLNFMEGWSGQGAVDTPPFAQAGFQAIADFVISANNGWLGADTSYPFAIKALFPGQNEALFRKRYRV